MTSQKDLFTPQLNTTGASRLKIVQLCIENSGFNYFPLYGLSVDYDEDIYGITADALEAKSTDTVCHEHVLMDMISAGHALTITDEEDSGEIVGSLSMQTIMKNWDAIDARHLLAIRDEQDDADTADCILQTLCFGSVIYG